MRTMFTPRAAAIVALLSVCALLPCPAQADEADDLIKTITAKGGTRAEQAGRMVASAQALGASPATQIRLCEAACEYGMMSLAGYPAVLDALDLLEDVAPDKVATWRDKRVDVHRQRYYKGDRQSKVANGETFIAALAARAEQCRQDKDWAGAAGHYRTASGVARTLNLPNKTSLTDLAIGVEGLIRTRALLDRLEAVLAKKPTDAMVRMQVVMAYLVDLDAPDQAAKHLGDSLDPVLRANVVLATKDPSELADDDFLTLGQWFKDLAKTTTAKQAKIAMLTRSQDNLTMYLEVHATQDVKRLAATNALKAVVAGLKALGISNEPAPPGWTDILAGINLERHALSGEWTRKGTDLTGTSRKYALAVAPMTARGGYDMQVIFTVTSGHESTVILPVGTGCVAMIFGGWGGPVSGLGNIGDEEVNSKANPTRIQLDKRQDCLRIGSRMVLDVAVRIEGDVAQVVAALDGKKVIDWKGDPSTLTVPRHMEMPTRAFALVTYASRVTWHAGRVRFLDPADQNVKWISKGAMLKLSSVSEKYPPLKALVTGQGALNRGCAIHTNEELNAHVILTLKEAVDVKRILLVGRVGKYSSYGGGAPHIWTSMDGEQWQELWQAKSAKRLVLIDLAKPVRARYVKIGLVEEKRRYLALAGVRIYAATGEKKP